MWLYQWFQCSTFCVVAPIIELALREQRFIKTHPEWSLERRGDGSFAASRAGSGAVIESTAGLADLLDRLDSMAADLREQRLTVKTCACSTCNSQDSKVLSLYARTRHRYRSCVYAEAA
jgi:hypothetical protein